MRILLASIFILIFGLLDLFDSPRSVFHRFSAPIQYGLRHSAVVLKDSFKLFHNLNDIRKQNLFLLKENQELKGVIVDLKMAEEENELLRSQLKLKNEEFFDKELLMALVMGNPNDLTGTSLVLDKGTRQGVKVGDNAVVGNVLVGVVSDVSEERCVMDLLVSPQVSITVVNSEPASRAEGLARGDLGTSIKVTRLLPGEKVDEGDIFVSTGRDGRILPGLVIGQVSEVTLESAEPLKSAVLSSLVEYSRLEKVFIILGL